MKKIFILILFFAIALPLRAQKISDGAITTIDRAMGDELNRSKNELRLNGLIDPFFISYTVNDNQRLDIVASFGALTRSNQTHSRQLNLRLLRREFLDNLWRGQGLWRSRIEHAVAFSAIRLRPRARATQNQHSNRRRCGGHPE